MLANPKPLKSGGGSCGDPAACRIGDAARLEACFVTDLEAVGAQERRQGRSRAKAGKPQTPNPKTQNPKTQKPKNPDPKP